MIGRPIARLLLAASMAALGLPAGAGAKVPDCAMLTSDRQWVEQSFNAWSRMDKRLELAPVADPIVVLFDERCRFERSDRRSKWAGSPHGGSVRLPDGNTVPVQVTSFAGQDEKAGRTFFVMALPTIWAKAGIPISNDRLGLTGVFLHEFSHTRQVAPLSPVFDAAESVRPMPDDFNDDSLQKHFEADPAYVAVIEKERDLLFRSAAEPDDDKARKLAGEALALMEARQKRWFTGDDRYWKNYDDLFLTMEGFGQWVAYSWLADPQGGRLDPGVALGKMRGSRRWWSQEEGMALFLVIDRFVPGWTAQAFAARPALGIDLLRKAVAD